MREGFPAELKEGEELSMFELYQRSILDYWEDEI